MSGMPEAYCTRCTPLPPAPQGRRFGQAKSTDEFVITEESITKFAAKTDAPLRFLKLVHAPAEDYPTFGSTQDEGCIMYLPSTSFRGVQVKSKRTGKMALMSSIRFVFAAATANEHGLAEGQTARHLCTGATDCTDGMTQCCVNPAHLVAE